MRDGEIVFNGPSRDLTATFLREIYGEASEELILPDADDFSHARPTRAECPELPVQL